MNKLVEWPGRVFPLIHFLSCYLRGYGITFQIMEFIHRHIKFQFVCLCLLIDEEGPQHPLRAFTTLGEITLLQYVELFLD